MQLSPRSAAGVSTPAEGRSHAVVWAATAICGWSLLLQMPLWTAQPTLVVANAITAAAWVVAGILLARNEQGGRTARGFVITGALWSLEWSGGWGGHWPLIATYADSAFWVAVAYSLLSYPLGRLQTGTERAFMTTFIVWDILTLSYMTSIVMNERLLDQIDRWTSWTSLYALFPSTAMKVFSAGSTVVGIGFVLIVVARWRRADALDRQEMWPFFVAAAGAAVAGGPLTWLGSATTSWNVDLLTLTLPVLAPPLTFGYVAVKQRLLVASISAALLNQPASVEGVEHALRAAFCDPELQVWYWLGGREAYVDTQGRQVDVDAIDQQRIPVLVQTVVGAPLAMIIVPAAMRQRRDLIRSIVNTSRVILENAQLQAAVRADLQEVRAAQNRILALDKAERRQLANDLHDGVQQRMIALLWRLNLLRTRTTDDTVSSVLVVTADELRQALEELRNIAAGIDPTQAGLGPAVERMTERIDIPIEVSITDQLLPSPTASTAYYVISEGITNSIKHADANRLTVVAHLDGDRLEVEVADDGQGTARLDGRGLTALRDRVRAFGGTLTVSSQPGTGTRLKARLPCESP